MAEVHETMARRLGETRRKRQLTLQAVADRAGIAKSHVWELEQGRNPRPSIATGVALAKALGCSFGYLTGISTDEDSPLHPDAMRIALEVDQIIRERTNG